MTLQPKEWARHQYQTNPIKLYDWKPQQKHALDVNNRKGNDRDEPNEANPKTERPMKRTGPHYLTTGPYRRIFQDHPTNSERESDRLTLETPAAG